VQGQIYVVPTPAFRNGALDPADPLNWSPARKWTIVALLILWSASALSVQSFLTNFLPSVEERFPNASASQVNLLITIVTPMICPGQLFFTPLAIHYGRRFSLLLSIVLLMVSTIWGACSTSYSSLLGARIVEGLAGGPTDALGFTIVQDFAFQHQRGKMLGAIMMGQQALTLVLAIVTNYMAVTTGFR
jgi:MFS family permease